MRTIANFCDHLTDPVFFSNCSEVPSSTEASQDIQDVSTVCSMKDAVRFASSNNLMGLICPSYLLVRHLPFYVIYSNIDE